MLKLDIFPHIFPQPYFERMKKIAEGNPSLAGQLKRWMHIPVLWDLDKRMRMMKRFPEYKQILTLSMPAIEFLGNPQETPELARLANDGMAQIVRKHPEQFPAFVASLPMNNVPASLEEMDRAIGKLGAKGIQIFTNVNGRPLDEPEFFPVFERMANKYALPVWVHPSRTAKFADYPTEQKSKYEIWWLFGWPYETSAFMARLVFSGMLDRLPQLRIITHHLGASGEDGQAPGGLLQDVLRRHLGERRAERDPLRPRLLRRKARAVRHRLPLRPAGRPALHPRDDQGAGRPQAEEG